MRPDIFMENVVSLLIIFSISLTGLSFHGTQRPLCLGWAVHPSYSVCESPLMSLHLCRAQPAFSNHLQKPSFSHLLNCCYTLPSIWLYVVLHFSYCYICVSLISSAKLYSLEERHITWISSITSSVPQSVLGMQQLLWKKEREGGRKEREGGRKEKTHWIFLSFKAETPLKKSLPESCCEALYKAVG